MAEVPVPKTTCPHCGAPRVCCAQAYAAAQADMWHRMALAQAVAGLANWSA